MFFRSVASEKMSNRSRNGSLDSENCYCKVRARDSHVRYFFATTVRSKKVCVRSKKVCVYLQRDALPPVYSRLRRRFHNFWTSEIDSADNFASDIVPLGISRLLKELSGARIRHSVVDPKRLQKCAQSSYIRPPHGSQ